MPTISELDDRSFTKKHAIEKTRRFISNHSMAEFIFNHERHDAITPTPPHMDEDEEMKQEEQPSGSGSLEQEMQWQIGSISIIHNINKRLTVEVFFVLSKLMLH